jgi:hypothetical protein
VLAIRPGVRVEGPGLSLRLRIKANRGRAVGVAGAQSVALIAVALASTLTGLDHGLRITLAIVGALFAAGLQLVPPTPLRAPWMPSPAPVATHKPETPDAEAQRATGARA